MMYVRGCIFCTYMYITVYFAMWVHTRNSAHSHRSPMLLRLPALVLKGQPSNDDVDDR